MRKGMQFKPYTVEEFKNWEGYDIDQTAQFLAINKDKHQDVYIATATIE